MTHDFWNRICNNGLKIQNLGREQIMVDLSEFGDDAKRFIKLSVYGSLTISIFIIFFNLLNLFFGNGFMTDPWLFVAAIALAVPVNIFVRATDDFKKWQVSTVQAVCGAIAVLVGAIVGAFLFILASAFLDAFRRK